MEETRLEYALEKYRKGEITIGRAAEIAKIDLREMIVIAAKKGIHFQYSKEDLIEDFRAAKKSS